VDVGAALVADEQALEVVQPGEAALDHSAEAAEPETVLALAPGDLGGGCRAREGGGGTCRGRSLGRRSATRGRRGRRPIRAHPARRRGGDQLRDVVPVAARERPSEREAGRLDEEMVLQRFLALSTELGPVSQPLLRLHVAGVDDCPRSLDRRRCPQPLEQKRVQPLPHPRPLPLV
jgi:hypothetical protein